MLDKTFVDSRLIYWLLILKLVHSSNELNALPSLSISHSESELVLSNPGFSLKHSKSTGDKANKEKILLTLEVFWSTQSH